MSDLKPHEKITLEKIFESANAGYVLTFSNSSFSYFFEEHKIDIYNEKYNIKGNSKMNRLRAFWDIEPNLKVREVLDSLLKCAEAIKPIDPYSKEQALLIINRLNDSRTTTDTKSDEASFLSNKFETLDLDQLKLDPLLTLVIRQRIDEIQKL